MIRSCTPYGEGFGASKGLNMMRSCTPHQKYVIGVKLKSATCWPKPWPSFNNFFFGGNKNENSDGFWVEEKKKRPLGTVFT